MEIDVKELRTRLGLSQPEFALRLKVSAIAVSRWERGVQHPREDARKRIERLAKRYEESEN